MNTIAVREPGGLAVQAEPLVLYVEKVKGCLRYLAPYVGSEIMTTEAMGTLCVRLEDWRSRFGCTSADVAEACRLLVNLDVLGTVMGRPTLYAAFTRQLAKAIRKRHAREEAVRTAAEREERLSNPPPRGPGFTDEDRARWLKGRGYSDELAELVAGIGTPVGGGRRSRPTSVRGNDRGDQSERDREPQAGREEIGGDDAEADAGAEAVEEREAGEAQARGGEGREG